MKFKMGADPEVFLKDATEGLISSIGRIGGTKWNPMPLSTLGEGYAVLEDNVALEYNIPPAGSKEQLVETIDRVTTFLKKVVDHQGLHFAQESAAVFPTDQLEHPMAREFGCDPDFNAWLNGKINPRPEADDWRLRSCGGHIHIGLEKPQSKKEIIRLVKHMDLYAAVPSIIMDKGELRKQLYGKRGAFRFKPYGCEYRVLSNFWTMDRKWVEWAWDATSMAVDAWTNNKINIDEEQEAIQVAVDENNQHMARLLVEKHGLLVV